MLCAEPFRWRKPREQSFEQQSTKAIQLSDLWRAQNSTGSDGDLPTDSCQAPDPATSAAISESGGHDKPTERQTKQSVYGCSLGPHARGT